MAFHSVDTDLTFAQLAQQQNVSAQDVRNWVRWRRGQRHASGMTGTKRELCLVRDHAARRCVLWIASHSNGL